MHAHFTLTFLPEFLSLSIVMSVKMLMLFFCVFVGYNVMYKPRPPCCFGEMPVPASLPSS